MPVESEYLLGAGPREHEVHARFFSMDSLRQLRGGSG